MKQCNVNGEPKTWKFSPLECRRLEREERCLATYVRIPKEVNELKTTDPEGYKNAISDIADQLKEKTAEAVSKYFTVIVHDDEEIYIPTVAVKINLVVDQIIKDDTDGTV